MPFPSPMNRPHGPAQAGNTEDALPLRRSLPGPSNWSPFGGPARFKCACSGASRSEERNRGHGHEEFEARIVHQREAVQGLIGSNPQIAQ